GVAGGVVLIEHGRDRRRHGAEMHRYVLGLHHHLAFGVEQAGGSVTALLDVRGVRRADQHDPHLVARRFQRADHHLERDGIHQPLRSMLSPPGVASARQPGGTTTVDSGSSTIAGPSTRSGTPLTTVVLSGEPSKSASRSPFSSCPPGSASGSSAAGSAAATRTVTSSSDASGSE